MDTTFGNLKPAQKSLFPTLCLRAQDYASSTSILGDAVSAELVRKIDYDFSRQRAIPSLYLNQALRTKRLDDLIRSFVNTHIDAVVLDLGCGLDPRVLRCAPPAGVDWFDIDFPEVMEIRERFLPTASHSIGADLTTPGWLDGIPADRPTMIVADGLMAFLSPAEYAAMARALTDHFLSGEFAFNAYTPLIMRAANRSAAFKALGTKPAGAGFVDPREPERWGARLTLIEELLLSRAPEVAVFPQPARRITRVCALSTRVSRNGNWIVRYRF